MVRAGFPGRMGPRKGRSAAFVDPRSYPDLIYWGDVSDAANVVKDGSNNIGQLSDKSGNGNHATATGGQRPVWTANSLNGLPTMAFSNAATSQLQTPNITRSEDTFFMVINLGALTSTLDGILGFQGIPSGGGTGIYMSSTVMDWAITGTTAGTTALRSIPLPIKGRFIILSGRRSASQNKVNIYENNALLKQDAHTGGSITGPYRIGRDASGNSTDCSIAEVVIYGRYLSDAEMLNVENYLNNKWAVYAVPEGLRALSRGTQRYFHANGYTSLAQLPASKPLFLIFGQSNAEGGGWEADLSATLTAPITNALIWNGSAFATLQTGVNNQPYGAGRHGPELSFMYDLATDMGEVYVVKYAQGGTDLATRWVPTAQNLYNVFRDRVDAARYAYSFSTGVELVPHTAIWYQGESDGNPTYSAVYEANERLLFETIWAGVDIPGAQNLKIASVQVRDNSPSYPASHQLVKDSKAANAVYYAPKVTLVAEWEATTGDGVHADSASLVRIGNDCAAVGGATTRVS